MILSLATAPVTTDLTPLVNSLMNDSPAVVATLVIVYAFLRHMRADTQTHIEARRNADELFVTALREIRQDVRVHSEAARASDAAVATAVGELSSRIADLQRIEDRLIHREREADHR